MKKMLDKNKIHLSTPNLIGIPADERALLQIRKQRENIANSGKREEVICCANTLSFVQKFLDLGVTEEEFNIVLESFNQHPIDRFSNSNYNSHGIFEIDTQKQVDEIFDIHSLFENPIVANLFLSEIYRLIQNENSSKDYQITLAKFNKEFNKRKNNYEMIEKNNEVFVTYSWDSSDHKDAVLSFTDFLRKNGFDAEIDRSKSQESTSTDFTKMMHQAITDYNKVIIVLSEGYKLKADSFTGGVGLEYRLIINDIENNPKKYILVSFEEIKDNIFPANFRGREVLNMVSEVDRNALFAKLQDINLIDFAPVGEVKPAILKTEINDFTKIFESKSEIKESNKDITKVLQIEDLKTDFVGASSSSKIYNYFELNLLPVISNNTDIIIEEFEIEVTIRKEITNYSSGGKIVNNNKVFNKQVKERIYPGQSKEIQCGNLRIETESARIAFESNIQIKIYSDLGVTQQEFEIQPLLKTSGTNYREITLTATNFNL